LRPLNPENMPDDFEKKALNHFKQKKNNGNFSI
jgi:hypothetical protein